MKQHSEQFDMELLKNCNSSTTSQIPQTTRIKIRTGTTTEGTKMKSAQLRADTEKISKNNCHSRYHLLNISGTMTHAAMKNLAHQFYPLIVKHVNIHYVHV